MKRFLLIAICVMAYSVNAVSCDRYDDGRPSKAVRNQFDRMYSDAKDIEWDREGEYWNVSFETGSFNNRVDHEAWYDMAGNWIMSKTEMFLSSVPKKIKDYLVADPVYGSSSFRDHEVEFWETPSGNFYRFDIRHEGKEVEVDVTEDGTVTLSRYDF